MSSEEPCLNQPWLLEWPYHQATSAVVLPHEAQAIASQGTIVTLATAIAHSPDNLIFVVIWTLGMNKVKKSTSAISGAAPSASAAGIRYWNTSGTDTIEAIT